MPKTTFHATAQLKDGMQVLTQARQHQLVIDEPPALGGSDTGMNPVEVLLCALGACQSIVARAYAAKFGIHFDDFRVELTGHMDTDGFMGLSDVRCGYDTVSYDIHIKTDAPREKVEEFVAFIEKTCPVGDTIGNTVKMQLGRIVTD